MAMTHKPDSLSGDFSERTLRRRRQPPFALFAQTLIKSRDAAQHAQHQPKRQFHNCPGIGSGHVADRDAARPGGCKIDTIETNADLLDQLQARRRYHHRCRHRMEHMQ